MGVAEHIGGPRVKIWYLRLISLTTSAPKSNDMELGRTLSVCSSCLQAWVAWVASSDRWVMGEVVVAQVSRTDDWPRMLRRASLCRVLIASVGYGVGR